MSWSHERALFSRTKKSQEPEKSISAGTSASSALTNVPSIGSPRGGPPCLPRKGWKIPSGVYITSNIHTIT
jgi:hypothetical protein